MTDKLDIHNVSDEDFMKSSFDSFATGASVEASEASEELLDQSHAKELDSTHIKAEDELNTPELEVDEELEESALEEESEEDINLETDYKSEYNKLFEPMKAAGMDFQVKSIDEAKKLIQMGLDYNQKMSALKPHRKLLKMLENHDMLDESKINNIIDLVSGNKDAISKLIRDNGIDPLDIETADDNGYSPSDYSVSDQAVELDEVIDSIKSTASFADTMQVVTRQWDDASKQSIASEPQLLSVLNNHIASGLYAMVQERMQRERLMGTLSGLSDLDAYRATGDIIYQEGGMDKYLNNTTTPTNTRVATAPRADTSALNNQRRKASTQKPITPSKKAVVVPNLLTMSDEDFEKFSPY